MIKVNPVLAKLAFKYGMVTALFGVIGFVVFFYLGQQPWRNLISFFLDIVIIGLFTFLAIKDFKARFNNNILSFYHGMTVGFIVYLTAAAGFALFYFVFINWIEPDFISQYIAIAQEDMLARKDMIVAALNEQSYLEQYDKLANTTSSLLVMDAFIKRLMIGLVLTPIFSILLRNHRA